MSNNKSIQVLESGCPSCFVLPGFHQRQAHRVQVPPEDGLGGEFVLPENGLGGQRTSSGWSWTLREGHTRTMSLRCHPGPLPEVSSSEMDKMVWRMHAGKEIARIGW